MKKNNKRDTLNLIFSAFLILGFIVCSYFFLTMSAAKPELAPYINTLVFVVFGLIIFYATRVGEGKPVKRFSLWTLIILDIPALYAVLAQFIKELPLWLVWLWATASPTPSSAVTSSIQLTTQKTKRSATAVANVVKIATTTQVCTYLQTRTPTALCWL